MEARTDRATSIALIREVMGETGTSQKALALNAGQSEATISDALNPTGTRNFAAEWIFDQDNAFIVRFVDKLMLARGLTVESRRQLLASRIGELTALLVEMAS